MPCLIVLLLFLGPRTALICTWLAGWADTAFETRLWPLLGFFFMPWTTLAYEVAMSHNHQITGGWIVVMIVAVFFDLGTYGGSKAAS